MAVILGKRVSRAVVVTVAQPSIHATEPYQNSGPARLLHMEWSLPPNRGIGRREKG